MQGLAAIGSKLQREPAKSKRNFGCRYPHCPYFNVVEGREDTEVNGEETGPLLTFHVYHEAQSVYTNRTA